jgi:hypothetical protein
MKSVYVSRRFNIKKIYVDRAFDPCREKLAEMHIELICCDKNAHVHFVERGIRFIKERVRCIRSMLPKRIKKVPKKIMIEIVYATAKLVNLIRRKGEVHPVMSPRQIVTGRRLVIPPFPPGAFVYAVPGASISSVDKSRAFDTLYMRPNEEGGGGTSYTTLRPCRGTQWDECMDRTRNQFQCRKELSLSSTKMQLQKTNRMEWSTVTLTI